MGWFSFQEAFKYLRRNTQVCSNQEPAVLMFLNVHSLIIFFAIFCRPIGKGDAIGLYLV